jgi:hypothetical protein
MLGHVTPKQRNQTPDLRFTRSGRNPVARPEGELFEGHKAVNTIVSGDGGVRVPAPSLPLFHEPTEKRVLGDEFMGLKTRRIALSIFDALGPLTAQRHVCSSGAKQREQSRMAAL